MNKNVETIIHQKLKVRIKNAIKSIFIYFYFFKIRLKENNREYPRACALSYLQVTYNIIILFNQLSGQLDAYRVNPNCPILI